MGSALTADDRFWNGGGEGAGWNEALNWGGVAPEAGDTLHFAGSVGLAPVNNFAGGTVFDGLVFDSGAGSFVLGGNAIGLNGSLINNSGNSQTINLLMNMGAVARRFQAVTGDLTVSQAVSGTGGLIKDGSGVLTLGAANSFTGGVTINVGTLKTSAGNAIAVSNALTLNGGTFDLGGGQTVASLNGTGGTITANGGSNITFTLNSSTNDIFGGKIQNGTRTVAFTKNGTGSLTLTATGALTSAQVTTINGGSLILGHTTAIGLNHVVSIGAGSLGFASGITDFSIGTMTGTGALTLEDTAGQAVNLTVNRPDRTFGGSLNGSGTLVISALNFKHTGALNLSGGIVNYSNSRLDGDGSNYTGKTTIGQNTLTLGHGNALGNSGEIVFNGGTLAFATSNTTDYSSRLLTIETNAIARISVAGEEVVTFASPLTGDGSLIKTGAGVLNLTGSNGAYTGTTTISGGKLAVSFLKEGGVNSSIGNSGSAAENLVINGGTLSYIGSGGADGTTNRLFTIGTGGATLEASGAGAVEFNGDGAIGLLGTNAARTLTLNGSNTGQNSLALAINNNGSGATSLTKSGVGTWVLTAENTYTGATSVNEGSLIINGSIVNSSSVEVAAGASLGGHGALSHIGGSGAVKPGNSAGVMTAESIDGSRGLDFDFEFTLKTVAPDFSNALASGNDVLRIKGGNPFSSFSLTGGNTITLDFSGVADLQVSDVFLGGFFADQGGDFYNHINAATFAYVGLEDEMWVSVTTIEHLANFTGGDVSGYMTRFEIRTSAIPEPGTCAMLILSGVAMLALRKRRS